MNPRVLQSDERAARAGVIYGLSAYTTWGLVPVYFKAVANVPAAEVLAHRIVWTLVLLVVVMTLGRRWKEIADLVRDRRTLLTLLGSTAFIACNWFLFIWSVAHDQLMQASLGYFINPLLSVLLGFVFLGERLRPGQFAGVVLAAISVTYLTVAQGAVPLLALGMATSFGFYGLFRKVARVRPMVGLTVESGLLFSLGAAYLVYLAVQGRGHLGTVGRPQDLLLMCSGPVTAIPLLLFAAAARRLRLATVGFMQYIAPTGQFLLAVFAYGEPFKRAQALAFAGIWTALAIYTVDTVRAQRGRRV